MDNNSAVYDVIEYPITVRNTLYSAMPIDKTEGGYDVIKRDSDGSPRFFAASRHDNDVRPAMPLPKTAIHTDTDSDASNVVDYCIVKDGKSISVKNPDRW